MEKKVTGVGITVETKDWSYNADTKKPSATGIVVGRDGCGQRRSREKKEPNQRIGGRNVKLLPFLDSEHRHNRFL
jgi:hypothetical protein